jgi:hypothetical protein
MVRRTSCVIAMALALLGAGQVYAGSETLTVALTYSAAPLCPELADFKNIVANRLGYDAFQPEAPDHVLVEILPTGHTFEGRIEWRTAEGKWAGERKFPSRSGDCQELARAIAFALALQIQFSAATGTRPTAEIPAEPPETAKSATESPAPPAPPPPPVQPEPQKKVETPVPPEQLRADEVTPKITYELGTGGAVGFGMSSGLTPLARAFADLGWRSLVAEIAGEFGFPTITRREDGAGFGQQLFLASVAGCGIVDRANICLLFKGGLIRIAGQDIDDPSTPSGSIFQAGARLGLTQPLGWRLFAVLQMAGLINLTRWRVYLDGFQVWSSPRLAATLGLDIGVSLP